MYWHSSEEFKFSSKHRQLLTETEISYEGGPGTILRDFQALLTYIEEQEPRMTGAYQLPLRTLPEINARLAHPIKHGLKRPVQKSFPHINGLYLLVRASGLTDVDETGSKPHLSLNQDAYDAWQRLNATEQYGTLLESWLLRGKPEIIGERGARLRIIPDTYDKWLSFFMNIPEGGEQIAGSEDEDRIKY